MCCCVRARLVLDSVGRGDCFPWFTVWVLRVWDRVWKRRAVLVGTSPLVCVSHSPLLLSRLSLLCVFVRHSQLEKLGEPFDEKYWRLRAIIAAGQRQFAFAFECWKRVIELADPSEVHTYIGQRYASV